MDFEEFDEPRRCAQCHVVTYCDRCPICGRELPRTKSKRRWRNAFGDKEEENIIQPKRTLHQVRNANQTKTLERTADVTSYTNDHNKSTKSGKRSKVVGVSVFCIVTMSILLTLGYFITEAEKNAPVHSLPLVAMESTNSPIELESAQYERATESITFDLYNISQTGSYSVNLYFYKGNQVVSTLNNILVLPDNIVDIQIKMETEPDAYILYSNEIHENLDESEEFFYTNLYWDDGIIRIILYEETTPQKVEKLIRYYYNKMISPKYEDWNELVIFLMMDDEYWEYYSVTFEDDWATAVYSGSEEDGFPTMHFALK